MFRYCPSCEKVYDFPPLAVSGKEDLICPGCGRVIAKNSRHPARDEGNSIEEGVGKLAALAFFLSYHCYFWLGIAGTICYLLNKTSCLYALTALSLSVFALQLFSGTLVFKWGCLLLPLGSLLAYFWLRTAPGACLGIHLVFLIRHLVRHLFFRLIAALVHMGQKP